MKTLIGSGHPLYNCWVGIKHRCYNHKRGSYKDYGGRGIKMCKRWYYSPEAFYHWCYNNGWKPGLVLDRINNDGNYEPNNCRWTTVSVNNYNRRAYSATGYRGVYKEWYWVRDKRRTWYSAKVKYQGKLIHVGKYKTPKKAAIERDRYIRANLLPHTLTFKW